MIPMPWPPPVPKTHESVVCREKGWPYGPSRCDLPGTLVDDVWKLAARLASR